MKFDESDILECQRCHKNTIRRGPVQKFCSSCSAQVDRERKQKWSKENPRPYDPAKTSVVRTRRNESLAEVGRNASEQNRASISWMASEEPSPGHILRVSVPFSWKMSKNAIWSMAVKQGHVFARQETNDLRRNLSDTIRGVGAEWFEGKVWLDIFVEKPDARGDAVNMVDFVCDAVKDAIDVDDRWFSIRRLDWSIVKENPRLFVGISQEIQQHHRCCSYCGTMFPLTTEFFGIAKHGRLGYGRECKKCLSALREKRKTRNA